MLRMTSTTAHFFPMGINKDWGPTIIVKDSPDFELMQSGTDSAGNYWRVEASARQIGWVMDALKAQGASVPDKRIEITGDDIGMNAADVAKAIVFAMEERGGAPEVTPLTTSRPNL